MQIMKKYFLILMLSLLTPSVYADVPNQVVLHYTGDIITRPCTVSTKTMNFDFGNVDLQKFQKQGDTSHWVSQAIDFTNCDTDTNIEIWFALGSIFDGTTGCNSILVPTFEAQYDSFVMDMRVTYNNKEYDVNCNYIGYFGQKPLILTPISRALSSGSAAHVEVKTRLRVKDGAVTIMPQSAKNLLLNSMGGGITVQYK